MSAVEEGELSDHEEVALDAPWNDPRPAPKRPQPAGLQVTFSNAGNLPVTKIALITFALKA